jgi:hypothetical protein
MTFSNVAVKAQWTDGTTFGEGNFQFVASGDLMDDAQTSLTTPIVRGQLDSTGSLWDGVTVGSGVSLLASSNFAVGYLTWNVYVQVRGEPVIEVNDVVVDYTLGATQGLFSILETAGWVATAD